MAHTPASSHNAIPTGAASGDLAGTYPSPTVADGLAVSKLAGYPTDATKTPTGAGTWVTSVAASQTAITDLNLGVLTLLTDAITAIGTIQTKVNTLLAELRTARLLSP